MDTFSRSKAKLVALAIAAFASTEAYSQQGSGVFRGGVVAPSNKLGRPEYQTYAPITLFVDQAGNDTNACTSPGVNACRTDQGALNKLPKEIRHPVRINHPDGGGNYGCFVVSGFYISNVTQADAGSTGGSIFLHAPQSVSTTLATGTATGTSTGGSAGSGTTFGTLVDATQTWTTNDLQGRFAAHGTQFLPIVANTATTVTVAGIWTSPGVGTAYEIQDNKTVINNACEFAAVANAAGTSLTNYAAILTAGTDFSTRQGALRISGYRFENTTGFGIARQGTTSLLADRLQFTSAMTGTSHVLEAIPAGGNASYNTSSSIYPGTTNTHFAIGSAGATNLINVYMKGGAIGANYTSAPNAPTLSSVQADSFNTVGFGLPKGAAPGLINVVTNGTAASKCIVLGTSSTTAGAAGLGAAGVSGWAASGCSTGLEVVGPQIFAVSGATGSVGTAYRAIQGGKIRVTAASTLAGMQDGGTGLGTGNDIDLDVDWYSLADMRAPTAVSSKIVSDGTQGSAVFQ